MALVVFFRGINVGGHRNFRPSLLAKELAELRQKLPFEANIACCDGADFLRVEDENPFRDESSGPDIVQFLSILSKAGRPKRQLPISIPEDKDWFVRILCAKNQFVF